MYRKTIYEKWIELEEKKKNTESNIVVEYFLSKKSITHMYIGISTSKEIYIEFENKFLNDFEPIEMNGISLTCEKIDIINASKKYIVVRNLSNNNEIFLAFSKSVSDAIIDKVSYYDVYKSLLEIIVQYKEYFKNPNKQLTMQEEQGLCAELIELSKLIDVYGDNVVLNWQGPSKNKRDFIFERDALEIKSTISQIDTSIRITNENQLDPKFPEYIGNLYLKVYILDRCDIGLNVYTCGMEVFNKLKDVNIKSIFIANLLKLKIDLNKYKPKYNFTAQKEILYLVSEEFPKITRDSIPNDTFDVSYRLSLSNLNEFEVKGDIRYE